MLGGASISARCPREDRAHALHALPLEAKSGTRKQSKNQLDVGERQLRVAHPLRAYGVRTCPYGGITAHEPPTVPRTGFEPVVSALRGQCPGPLDERAGDFHCTERDPLRSHRALSDLVAPGIRRIPIPLPIRGLPIVNTYLVEAAHGWSLVDAGMHTAEAEHALRGGLADAGIGLEDVHRVFVTHLHPDHIGMAGTLERAGAAVLMHTPEIAAARRVWSKGHEAIDATYQWFARHGMPQDVDEGMRQAWIAIDRKSTPSRSSIRTAW